jgi:hypothetical protein
MYIGSPFEVLDWERAIIQAGQDMQEARNCLYSHHNALPNAISAGIRCSGPAGNVC